MLRNKLEEITMKEYVDIYTKTFRNDSYNYDSFNYKLFNGNLYLQYVDRMYTHYKIEYDIIETLYYSLKYLLSDIYYNPGVRRDHKISEGITLLELEQICLKIKNFKKENNKKKKNKKLWKQ